MTIQSPHSTPASATDAANAANYQHDKANEFEELTALLLKEERSAISELKEHFESFQQRKTDVVSVLPAAIHDASQQQGALLIEALRMPVLEAIAISGQREHAQLSDALAPVIGPAILRSIAETLRRYTETMEALARNNLTLQGLKWRLEAHRTGIPFSEIVLKYTLLYRVEELFLIHKPSGLLIAHLTYPGLPEKGDKDAIAGMMSAIHSFSRDSLMTDTADSLEAIDLGGRQLRLVQGPHAMLACVNRGTTPPSFLDKARETLDGIHRQFYHNLREYNGDVAGLKDVNYLLEHLLAEDSLDTKNTVKKPLSSSPILKAFGLILVVSMAWYAFNLYETNQQKRIVERRLQQELQAKLLLGKERQRILNNLDGLPGLVIAHIDRVGSKWQINGLADPLGPTKDEIAKAVNIKQNDLQLKLRPYLSLDPVLLLKRAKTILAPPNSVNIHLEGTKLIIAGEAEAKWIEGARYHSRVHLPPYFSLIDLSGLLAKTNKKRTREKI
jgi:hypothetical protein